MAAMKWWGWGLAGAEFTHEDKPDLGPFLKEALGLDVGRVTAAPIRFEDLHIPEPRLPDDLRGPMQAACDEMIPVAAFPFGLTRWPVAPLARWPCPACWFGNVSPL